MVGVDCKILIIHSLSSCAIGNTKSVGEGTILGGLLIVSSRGIEYEYAEKVWGDHAPIADVLKVVEKFPKV